MKRKRNNNNNNNLSPKLHLVCFPFLSHRLICCLLHSLIHAYSLIQVRTADSPKKKTLKLAETDEDDFKRQDLNPGARVALERVYTRHPDFYQLNTKVLDEGSLLKQDVLDIYRKTGETLTYEQLLQGS